MDHEVRVEGRHGVADGFVLRRRVGRGVGDVAFPQHVVDHDQPADAQELEAEIEAAPIRLLVGVEVDEVEGGREPWHHLQRLAREQLDAIGNPGPGQGLARPLQPLRIAVDRHHLGLRRGPGQPQSAVPDGGPHLEDPPGAERASKNRQKLSHLRIRDRDRLCGGLALQLGEELRPGSQQSLQIGRLLASEDRVGPVFHAGKMID